MRRRWVLVSVDLLGSNGGGCGAGSGSTNGNGLGRGENTFYNGDGSGPWYAWGNGATSGIDGNGEQISDDGAFFEIHSGD